MGEGRMSTSQGRCGLLGFFTPSLSVDAAEGLVFEYIDEAELKGGETDFREIEYVESSHADPRFEAGDETGLNWVRVGCHFVYRLKRRR